jgi:hypothetical protein
LRTKYWKIRDFDPWFLTDECSIELNPARQLADRILAITDPKGIPGSFAIPSENNDLGKNYAQLQDPPGWGGRLNEGCEVHAPAMRFGSD